MMDFTNRDIKIDGLVRNIHFKDVLRQINGVSYFIFPQEDLTMMNCYETNCVIKRREKYTLLIINDLQKSQQSLELVSATKTFAKIDTNENEHKLAARPLIHSV